MARRLSTHLISGFLGSGKTTLLRRVLGGELAGERVAVLVNEFGTVGVDGARLSGGDLEVVELPSGCVCCTLRSDLVRSVDRIARELNPDRLPIKTSGLAQPAPCVAALRGPELASWVAVEPVICVVDAARFHRWRAALPEIADGQVRGAGIVLFNKADLVGGPPARCGRNGRSGTQPNRRAAQDRAVRGGLGRSVQGRGA